MTENIEKERKAYLGPSWTKDARDQEDLADLRRYNTKLGDCQAMHRWEVQRMPKPAVSPSRRPGRMSSTTSVMAELAQGVPTEQSRFMAPDPDIQRRHVRLHSKPTVAPHHIRPPKIDPRVLDEHVLTKLVARGTIPPLPPTPVVPARGPSTLAGTAGRAAHEWSAGTRALSTWELSDRGETAFALAAERLEKESHAAVDALGELLKLTEKRSRRRIKPKEDIEGSYPRHPLQNPQQSLRGNCPRIARPPEECDYTPPYAAPAPPPAPADPGGPPPWFGHSDH